MVVGIFPRFKMICQWKLLDGLFVLTNNFPTPSNNLDCYYWNVTKIHAIETRIIWDSTRWTNLVWCKLKVNRYTFTHWLACLGRLPTAARLVRFGSNVDDQCLFCVAGRETANRLFLLCPYAEFILRVDELKLLPHTQVDVQSRFASCLCFACSLDQQIASVSVREVVRLMIQVLVYHI